MEKILPQYYVAVGGLHSFVHLRALRGSQQMTYFQLLRTSLLGKMPFAMTIPCQCNNPVNIRCLQDTLWIHFHHPYIWQHFDAATLSVPVCYIDLNIFWN